VLTFLFDKQKAMEALLPLEEAWGGNIAQRMERDAKRWAAAQAGKNDVQQARAGDGEGPGAA
jgi:penicillin-binding protein 2